MELRQASERELQKVLDFYHEASDEMIDTPYDCRWRRDMHPTEEFLAYFVRKFDDLAFKVHTLEQRHQAGGASAGDGGGLGGHVRHGPGR